MKKRKAAVLAAAAFAMTAAFFLNGIQRAEAADNVVVMLDPGHDTYRGGSIWFKRAAIKFKNRTGVPYRA